MRLRLTIAVLTASLLLSLSWPQSSAPARAEPEANAAAQISTDLLFECLQDNTIRVVFTWVSSGQGPQWVDLSLFDNGFALGTFLGSGPIDAGQRSLIWDGLLPNTLHFVRVNTLTASGWFPSQTMTFVTPNDCPFAVTAPIPLAVPSGCNGLSAAVLAGCVWTPNAPDFGSRAVGDTVFYCYAVSQPTNVRIIAHKPDGTALLVLDGFVSGPGACIGPFQANVPLGLRTVSMFAGPGLQLVSQTHFSVR
jgi:hypothetical protein